MTTVILPKEIKEAVVYSAREWPRAVNAERLLLELNALATRVYLMSAPTCGTCAYWLDEGARIGFCTSQVSWHNGRSMPAHEGCTKHQQET